MREDSPATGVTLIDRLLADQARAGTAVQVFSEWHEEKQRPAQAKYYQKLIPLQKPQQGEQYSFEVDLDKCTGCKACVVACHSLNGLDEEESWRDIGALVGTKKNPYLQTVTSACHHCLEPACASGCPVLAYEKDEATGIVRHLDDQCIGCSYCILKCPYDVPKFNKRKGIVRKCDMCHQRLSEGEAPACVQACPNEAIAIRVVRVSDVQARTTQIDAKLLPGTFASCYTKPSTNYVTSKEIPNFIKASNEGKLVEEEAHWPLAGMLVLTQLAAGIFLFSFVLSFADTHTTYLNVVATLIHLVALLLSVLHLGKPFRAWKAFLGWRKSWLSREILVFGAVAKVAVLTTAWPWIPEEVKDVLPNFLNAQVFTGICALLSLIGVYCSVMVYVDTRRAFWSWIPTMHQFFGTTLLLGLGGTSIGLTFGTDSLELSARVLQWCVVAQLIYGVLAIVLVKSAANHAAHPWHESALKLFRLKQDSFRWRGGLYLGSLILSGATLAQVGHFAPYLVPVAFMMLFLSEVLSRHLFFTCVTASRMPGVQASSLH